MIIIIKKTCSTRDVKALASLCDVLYSLAHGIRVPCPQVTPSTLCDHVKLIVLLKSTRKEPKRYRKAQDKPDEEPRAVFYEMFAHMKAKCPSYANEKKYAFHCQVLLMFYFQVTKLTVSFRQVALGKSKDIHSMPGDKPDGDFNSLRVIGKYGFSTAENEVKIKF